MAGFATLAAAGPVGTAFTYQGRLLDGTNAAKGTYDIRFMLYDAESEGNVVGPALNYVGWGVTNGLFTVTLDFGADVFDGNARWLETAIRPHGPGALSLLTPRQLLTATPYALHAAHAAQADRVKDGSVDAGAIAPGAVTSTALAPNAVNTSHIASGQVVKSLNGLQDTVTLAAGANVSLAASGNTLVISASGGGATGGWSTSGNAGTTPGANFLGTTDNEPLLFKANNLPVLRLDPNGSLSMGNQCQALDASAIAMGTNSVASGLASVALGSRTRATNRFAVALGNQTAADGFSSFAAGSQTTADGFTSFAAGNTCKASGLGSFALGWYANAAHDYSFVWGDGDDYWNTTSSAEHQFVIYARGGVGIGGPPGGDSLLDVQGSCRVNDHDLHLRSAPDKNHGLGWYGGGRPFAGVEVDGPVLYGNGGGALGVRHNGELLALGWDSGGNAIVDPKGRNSGPSVGTMDYSLTFGQASGEGIASQRVGTTGNPLGLDLYTDFTPRVSINNRGHVRFWNHVGICENPKDDVALNVNGEACKTGGPLWLVCSDARIKTRVATVTNALETLDKVRLVSFRYTDDYRAAHATVEDRSYLNVIAQEFQEVFPDFVKPGGETMADGSEVLQVDPYPLTIYSAAAVQELNARLKVKEAEIQDLKRRLEALEARVAPQAAK